jgi:hypothetical protein
MFDIAGWVQRAKTFIRQIANLPGFSELNDAIEPPATDEHSRVWLQSEKCSLPPEIHRFLSQGSKRCCFHYHWTPPTGLLPEFQRVFPGRDSIGGGADLCEAARYSIYDNRGHFRDLVKGQQQTILQMFANAGHNVDKLQIPHPGIDLNDRGSLLVLAPRIGDQELALQLSQVEADRGVVCVPGTGDRTPVKVSSGFEQFLLEWERIYYLSPTIENLRPWLDPDTGLLRPAQEAVRRLESLFSAASIRRDG